MFKHQPRRNVKVYVDDMLVMSIEADQYIANFKVLYELRQNQVKLNPNKCVFGMTSSKFLGFMVAQHRIKVNLKKIEALAKIKHPAQRRMCSNWWVIWLPSVDLF